MKTTTFNLILLGLSLGVLSGCAKSKSTEVMPEPKKIEKDAAVGSELKIEFNPQVDILFVIDNSASMKDEQERLQKGINSFVNGIGENSVIDYRVGVITVYDSRRCGRADSEGQVVQCEPMGRLQPIKTMGSDGKEVIGSPGFIARGDGSAEILKATLNVGAKELGQGGPQFEEMFSPVLVALSPAMNQQFNSGFIRKNSQVVVIFVSDENDSSDISVEEFVPTAQAILSSPADKINGADRLKMYGVLAVGGCPIASFAAPPARIVRAVKDTDGDVFKICDSSFGSSLSKIGSDIRKRLLKSKIQLNSVPEEGTLKVFYGSQELKAGQEWQYHAKSNSIQISENISVQPKPGAKFSVTYSKVDPQAIQKGRATGVVY